MNIRLRDGNLETLRIEILQFAPALGDVEANLREISEHAAHSQADLLVTPELATTGYDVGDDAAHLAVPVRLGAPLDGAGGLAALRPVVLLGIIERGSDGTPFNTLAAIDHGIVRFKHRKVYLPTYGMFDESRFFGRGRQVAPWKWRGWTIGLLVCEDLWHPGLAYVLASAGIDLLVVAAAPAGRGGRRTGPGPAGDASPGHFASAAAWERIAQTTAQLYGIYVALAMRTGVEGGVTYAGRSLLIGPDGETLACAPALENAVIGTELSPLELARARRPSSHRRDDDWRLVKRMLEQLDD